MKSLFALLLFSVSAFAQMPLGGITFQPVSGSCTLPADVIYDNNGWNASNLCGTTGGSSCTTLAQPIFSWADSVSGNTATQATTTAQPTYTPNDINGLGVGTFNGSSDFLSPGTTVASGTTVLTVAFAVKLSSLAATNGIMGFSSAGINFSVYVNTAGHVVIASASSSTIATGSTTLTTGTWYAFLVTYNTSTHAFALYRLSGGSATSDGSGTQSATISNPTWTAIGKAKTNGGSTVSLNGDLAEITMSTTAPIAGNYATYFNCKYGF